MDGKRITLTRRQLYQRVWKTPVDTLAKELGLSGRGLGKLCERHGIPVPPRGYWARPEGDQKPLRAPLLEIEGPNPDPAIDFWLSEKRSQASKRAPIDDGYTVLFESLLEDIEAIAIPQRMVRPHPIVAAWIAQDQERKRERRQLRRQHPGFGRLFDDPPDNPDLTNRRWRTSHAFFRALEQYGFSVESGDGLSAKATGQAVSFSIHERIREYRRPTTDAEREASWNKKQRWRQIREPTGTLELRIHSSLPSKMQSRWYDDDASPLDEKLRAAIATMLVCVAYLKDREEERKAEERRRLEEWAQQRHREEARQAEAARREALRLAAGQWRESEVIRSYVAAVSNAVASGVPIMAAGELEAWSAWALACADEIDPTKQPDTLKEDGADEVENDS
jgi:hypothetical protein